MGLLVLLADNPRLDTVEYHVVDCHPVSEMDRLLDTEDSEDLELNRGQVVEHLVELDVLSGRLDSLVDRDDQLVRLLDC